MLNDIKFAVRLAVSEWPNAHLGDNTPREDIASAFRFIRARLKRGMSLRNALGDLEFDAYKHSDM